MNFLEDFDPDEEERRDTEKLVEEMDTEIEMCPQGCGRTTEDPYGGPCKACWDKV